MDLRHLRYFLAVADELHFGRAAARLHIAQPPLSQQVKRLERELGVALFVRDRRHVKLTREGEILRIEARRTVAQADRLLDVAKDVRAGAAGRVRIAFVGSSLYGPLPQLMRAVRAGAADISLAVSEMETGTQLTELAEDRLDLGVLRPPVPAPSLAVRDLVSEDLVVALPEDHPLPVGKEVPLDALACEPFVLFPAQLGLGFWETVVQACGAAGFAPHIVYEAEHVHTMVGMVASGLGVSLVPASVRRLALWGVRYERLSGRVPQLRLALAWESQRVFPALERVVEIMIDESHRLTAAP